jgi:superfamily II DNA/RNA helicase
MTFAKTGLSAKLLATLEKEKFETPTPIQVQTIPLIREGRNVVAAARTGTGKTLAFVLPILDRLETTRGIALILVPTRELALQLERDIRRVCGGFLKMKPSVLISGIEMKRQMESLKTQPRIVIATPGRLNEHLDARSFKLDNVSIVVLDEGDRMLDSGFAPQIERILDRCSKDRQTLLFSATMTLALTSLVERYAPDATHIVIEDDLLDSTLIQQEICRIGTTRRVALLTKFLHNHRGSALVFTSTRRRAKALHDALKETTLSVVSLHSERTPGARAEAADGFRKGIYKTMITTDISARGLDIPTVSLVVNYDVPRDAETYIHRVGRTGRAGRKGRAITFVTPEMRKTMQAIEDTLGIALPVLEKAE